MRLVAEGALPLDPALAGRALQIGLQRCRENPYPGRRGLDRAGLCLVLARRDRQEARLLAAQITIPRVRSWTYRELSRLTQAEPDLAEALRAAGQIKDPGAKAISLAQTAGLYYQVRQKAGADLFKKASNTAGQVEDRQRRSFVQGEVAAAAVLCNARLAAQMADQVDAVNGACFKVWRRAWASMSGAASADRELLLAKAKNQAHSLPSDYEQNRALSLLASDLAVLDLSAAEDMKKALPRSMYYLRGEAETAMVLAEAGRDLNRAVAMAAGIEDQSCRILVSARLAAILVKRDTPKGLSFCQKVLQGADGPVKDLARAILAPALVVSDPKLAISEAARIADPSIRVKTLLRVAVRLAKNGGRPGAERALEMALETINSGKIKQTLDKARLLGHMGREWFELEADRARGFFAAGAKFAAESR